MRFAAVGLCLLSILATARAESDETAAGITEPGRSLDRALSVIVGQGAAEMPTRTLLFLLDPTPSLQAAGFDKAFAGVLARHAEALGRTEIGVAVVGEVKPRLAPTHDRAQVLEAVEAALASPRDLVRNVYLDVRRAAASLSGRRGAREVILVSLENGDAEDDLEDTVSALKRARVRFSAVVREAFLSDSFWHSASRTAPRGLEMGSGDGPFLELPWGWLFQMTLANETTPSGFALYGVNRLAASSAGRIFLYTAPTGQHHCAYLGTCLFCDDDHLPADESFQGHRMRTLAPLVVPRRQANAVAGRDPCYRALLKTWGQAAKEGLLRSRPSMKASAGGLKPERPRQGTWAPLLGNSIAFPRLAGKAEKLVGVCDQLIADLEGDLKGLGEDAGSGRYRAMAEFTAAMLHLTRANLVGYGAWCRETAPALLGKTDRAFEPPEVDPVPRDRRVIGISYTNLCLCHGVAPLRELRLPGGARMDEALERLDAVITAFLHRHAHTPYAMALRHQGLARFHFTYRGKTLPPPVTPRSGSTGEKPTTETARPPRGGSPSTGSGSGAPTTGGG